jgi:site-specific DNA-methyltransferase (adenine-specific)
LDYFAGSGTTGVAAQSLGRRVHLIDNNPAAIEIMEQRFAGNDNVEFRQ